MRQHYDRQRRFDCTAIAELTLNHECRDEMIPVLAGLQHVYTCQLLRNKVVKLVAKDINRDTRRDVGRRGLDDWQVVVLASVRLGCNYDYDKLKIKQKITERCGLYSASATGMKVRASARDAYAIRSANSPPRPLPKLTTPS